MTNNSSNTSDTEEIEFTAAYGTAVSTTRTRQPDIRSRQRQALREGSDNVSSDAGIATSTDQR